MTVKHFEFDLLKFPLYGIITVVGLYFVRRYFKGAQFRESVSAAGKIVLVTGCSSGIGKQTVRELNLRGANCYMLCRDVEKASKVRIDLAKVGCDPSRLIVKKMDLANFSSVRNVADELKREVDRVDVLINNAGIMSYPKFELTVDGNELTWQTNYLGHFLLTELMRPLLEKSDNGRVVNVSSSLHKKADSVDESIVYDRKKFNRSQPYYRSKLANIMHACELTRVIKSSNSSSQITVNSLHPGVCFTDLMRYSIANKPIIRQILTPFFWFFMKTDRDGAQTSLYLALSESVEGVSGKYFGECQEHQPSPKSLDRDACSVLYNYSIETVGLASRIN